MAVEVTEICLFWGDWQIQRWWSCMPKNEWSGWVQAIGAIASIQIAIWVSGKSARREKKHAIQQARIIAKGCVQCISSMSYGLREGFPGMIETGAIGIKEFYLLSNSVRPELLAAKPMEAYIGLKLNIAIILGVYETFVNENTEDNKTELMRILSYYKNLIWRDSETLHKRYGFVLAEKFSAEEQCGKLESAAKIARDKYKENNNSI